MLSISLLVQQDFGSEVFGRAAERVCELVVGKIGLRQSEIAEGDVTSGVEQDVFRFKIA